MNQRVLTFILLLCLVCSLLLAAVSFALSPSQEEAKEFERNKQMLIATKILHPKGYFQIRDKEQFLPALYNKEKKIVEISDSIHLASVETIKEVSKLRIHPLLLNSEGSISTFEELGIVFAHYLVSHKKEGYAVQENRLFFAITPNSATIDSAMVAKDLKKVEQVVIPIAGFGLWAPIYGYLAVASDGNTTMGATWYEHGETPGLGANITEPWWQQQFYGKVIFQESGDGKTYFDRAPLGLMVVKGKVRDVFGNSLKAKNAVDGISGATFTGDGVTNAYRESLAPYRTLFLKLQKTS